MRSARRRRQRPATGEMVNTELHKASWDGDAAKVERLLKQHPEWVHEKNTSWVRSARVWDRPLRAAVLRRRGVLR